MTELLVVVQKDILAIYCPPRLVQDHWNGIFNELSKLVT